jgi:hypothetical protein
MGSNSVLMWAVIIVGLLITFLKLNRSLFLKVCYFHFNDELDIITSQKLTSIQMLVMMILCLNPFLLRRDRDDAAGGGLLIYVRDGIGVIISESLLFCALKRSEFVSPVITTFGLISKAISIACFNRVQY